MDVMNFFTSVVLLVLSAAAVMAASLRGQRMLRAYQEKQTERAAELFGDMIFFCLFAMMMISYTVASIIIDRVAEQGKLTRAAITQQEVQR